MAQAPEPWQQALGESLARVNQALQRTGLAGPQPLAPLGAKAFRLDWATVGSAAGATAFVAIAVVTGHWWIIVPAVGLGGFAGLTWIQRLGFANLRRKSTRAHIGMGATVAADAVIEPGAAVEMGATVASGAVLRSGALVRMGSSVGRNAVLEGDAVVSWGASVGEGAVIGSGSIVGAGADVAAGARVPANTTLWPGTSFVAGAGAPRSADSPARAALPAAEDLRAQRITAVCDRLDSELRDAPESARSFLGEPGLAISRLRGTCEDLLRRERVLRAEAEPAALARLDEERAVLTARIASASDEVVKRSLTGAVAALDEQKRQRELLRRSADRLEAEQTRLLYTLEGMGAQFVRLRTAGEGVTRGSTTELEQSVSQLRSEIDAIADALDEVATPGQPVMERVAPIAPGPERPADEDPLRTR